MLHQAKIFNALRTAKRTRRAVFARVAVQVDLTVAVLVHMVPVGVTVTMAMTEVVHGVVERQGGCRRPVVPVFAHS